MRKGKHRVGSTAHFLLPISGTLHNLSVMNTIQKLQVFLISPESENLRLQNVCSSCT